MSKPTKIFIEQRPEGDYAARLPKSERASIVAPTQGKAIEKAKEMYPGATIQVERIRDTDAGGRDKWRKP